MPSTVPAELTVTRASTGTVFELRFDARLHVPCFRCLEDAVLDVRVSGREYQAANPGDDEELQTIYLDDDRLDLSTWARDAIALELPDKILCRPDCAGLCPTCGKAGNRTGKRKCRKLGEAIRDLLQVLAFPPEPVR